MKTSQNDRFSKTFLFFLLYRVSNCETMTWDYLSLILFIRLFRDQSIIATALIKLEPSSIENHRKRNYIQEGSDLPLFRHVNSLKPPPNNGVQTPQGKVAPLKRGVEPGVWKKSGSPLRGSICIRKSLCQHRGSMPGLAEVGRWWTQRENLTRFWTRQSRSRFGARENVAAFVKSRSTHCATVWNKHGRKRHRWPSLKFCKDSGK